MKRLLVILLALFTAFAMVGCKGGGGTEPGDQGDQGDQGTPGPFKLTVPKKIELTENTYDTGYQYQQNLGTGKAVKEGDEFTLDVEFTVSRAVPGGVQIGIVDIKTDYWNPLSYDGKAEEGTANAIFNTDKDLVPGTKYTIKHTFKALKASPASIAVTDIKLVFQTAKEYTRPEGDNGKHTAAANNPLTIFFEEVVPSGNPLEDHIVKALDPAADASVQTGGGGEKFYQFSFTPPITKFPDSKYVLIVTKGLDNPAGYGTITVVLQSEKSSWEETNSNGWINIGHTADDIVCFLIELDSLTGYSTWLTCASWAQFNIKYSDDVAKLGVQAVLLLDAGAGAVIGSPADKADMGGALAGKGFATKEIDVTGLY